MADRLGAPAAEPGDASTARGPGRVLVAVYGIFDDEGAAERAAKVVDAPFAGVYRPVSHGVEIV